MSWLDETNAARKKIFQAQSIIDDVSEALERVGMDRLSEELIIAINMLGDAEFQIRNATTEKVDADFKQAQESSTNILRAALAIAEMRGKE